MGIRDRFDTIESEVGPVEVVVFNIGANVFFSIRETTARVYRKVWEMAAFAGFLAGREAARVMGPRNKGTIIFTGATASLRGGKGFSAFAGAKFALRALAQSMARELGPDIRVNGVSPGPILWPEAGQMNQQDIQDATALKRCGTPQDIAETVWWLGTQAPFVTGQILAVDGGRSLTLQGS